jgi:HSP20 family protein
MNTRNLRSWMWGDALALLERADRLHRQFFQPSPKAAGSRPVWQPPVDVYETARELIMLIALPGVAAENVQVMFDGRVLSLVAERALPARDEALIRRLEIPYGRFERHLELTGDGLDLVQQELSNGCLALRFAKGDRQ